MGVNGASETSRRAPLPPCEFPGSCRAAGERRVRTISWLLKVLCLRFSARWGERQEGLQRLGLQRSRERARQPHAGEGTSEAPTPAGSLRGLRKRYL